jgi:hypothetical protein
MLVTTRLVAITRAVSPKIGQCELTHLARRSPEISQRSGVSVRVSVANTEVLEAAIVRTSRDGRYPSDHFPVTARVRLR